MATLISGADLAQKYGNINIDQNAIESVFNNATQKKYADIKAADARNFNTHLTGLARQQNTDLATLRAQSGQAINSGFSKGTQDANALLYMLGKQQSASADLTGLTQTANANQQAGATEIAQNRRDAMTQADTNKTQLLNAGTALYTADDAKEAQVAYANAYLKAAKAAANAQKYAANQSTNGTFYASDAAYTSALAALKK